MLTIELPPSLFQDSESRRRICSDCARWASFQIYDRHSPSCLIRVSDEVSEVFSGNFAFPFGLADVFFLLSQLLDTIGEVGGQVLGGEAEHATDFRSDACGVAVRV